LKNFNSIIHFVLLFSIIFVGDYALFGLPVIIIVTLTCLSLLVDKRRLFSQKKLNNYSYILLLLAILEIYQIIFGYGNYQIFWHLICYSILTHVIPGIRIKINPIFVIIIYILLLVVFYNSRIEFIFGPNIWYRILFFFWIFTNLHSTYLVTVPIISNSRGALVSILIYFLTKFRIKFKYIIFVILTVSLIFWGINFYFDILPNELKRLFLFSRENGSLNDRIKVFDFINIKSILVGLNKEEWELLHSFIRYPHNIILELILKYGIFGIILILMSLPIIRKNIQHEKKLILILLPLLFSGSILDNLGSITFLFSYDFEYYYNISRNKRITTIDY